MSEAATVHLKAVADLTERYYGETGEAERARAGADVAFVLRVLFSLPGIIILWDQIGDMAEAIRQRVRPDDRADFEETAAGASAHVEGLISLAHQLATEPSTATVQAQITTLSALATEVLAMVAMLDSPDARLSTLRVAHALMGKPSPPVSRLDRDLLAYEIQSVFTRLATQAIALSRALERMLSAASGESGEQGNTARVRRYRERRRRRVAFRAQVDIYADDIELLRQFGYVMASEKDDREAVTEGIELFLLESFLSYREQRGPWRDRVARQKRRIDALNDRDGAQDQQ